MLQGQGLLANRGPAGLSFYESAQAEARAGTGDVTRPVSTLGTETTARAGLPSAAGGTGLQGPALQGQGILANRGAAGLSFYESVQADAQLPTRAGAQAPSGADARGLVGQETPSGQLGNLAAAAHGADGNANARAASAARADSLAIAPPAPGNQGATAGPPASPVDDAPPTEGQGRETDGSTDSADSDSARRGSEGTAEGQTGLDKPPLSLTVPHPGIWEALARVRPVLWFVAGTILMATALIVWGTV